MIAPLSVRYVPLDRLTGYARNPRKNQHVIPRMVSSIKEFGFAIPVLVKPDYEIIDGHLRALAARELQMTEVPVIVADGWSEAQVKAFRLLANRSTNWAEWDFELLNLELNELRDFSFDLNLTGFDEGEIANLFNAEWEPPEIDRMPEKEEKSHPHTIHLSEEEYEVLNDAIQEICKQNDKKISNGECVAILSRYYLDKERIV